MTTLQMATPMAAQVTDTREAQEARWNAWKSRGAAANPSRSSLPTRSVAQARSGGGREEDSISLFRVGDRSPHSSSWSVTSDEEEAGTIGPTRRSERIRKLFTNHRDLSSRDQVIAQRGSVPQARGHSASGPKGLFVRRSGFLLGRTAIFRFSFLWLPRAGAPREHPVRGLVRQPCAPTQQSVRPSRSA